MSGGDLELNNDLPGETGVRIDAAAEISRIQEKCRLLGGAMATVSSLVDLNFVPNSSEDVETQEESIRKFLDNSGRVGGKWALEEFKKLGCEIYLKWRSTWDNAYIDDPEADAGRASKLEFNFLARMRDRLWYFAENPDAVNIVLKNMTNYPLNSVADVLLGAQNVSDYQSAKVAELGPAGISEPQEETMRGLAERDRYVAQRMPKILGVATEVLGPYLKTI